MAVRAFVFDLDGTLVDSKIDFATMRTDLRVSADDDILESIAARPPHEQEAALEIVHRHEWAGANGATAIKGAREFVARAKSQGHHCAVFTRNSRAIARQSLQQCGFEIDLVIAREDAAPKPKPDGLFLIAKQWKLHVSEILFVGDYLYDLQAGLAAGMPTVLYLPSDADFNTANAEFTFQLYGQLEERIFLP